MSTIAKLWKEPQCPLKEEWIRKLWSMYTMEYYSAIRNNKCWRGCGERGSLLYCWWECELVQPLWKTVWRFLKELKIKLPMTWQLNCWEFTPKIQMQWKAETPAMFIAAMATIAKLWKEPRCPSKDEWISCGLCIQWNITQPLEMTNTHHLLQRGWTWRVLCWVK